MNPPDIRYRHISLKDIDMADQWFQLSPCISNPEDTQDKDLQGLAIYLPPLLQEQKNTPHRILSGFTTLMTARCVNHGQIVCALLPASTPLITIFTAILQHRTMTGSLSVLEQAIFLDKVRSSLGEEAALAFLPRLGRKAQPYVLKELTGLLRLDQDARQALHQGALHPRTAGKLLRFSSQDQNTLVDLILWLQLGTGKQQRLVDSAWELTMRHAAAFNTILAGWPEGKLRGAHENRPQLASSLLSWLHEQCFPESSRAEESFRAFRQQLDLPPGVHLAHTPAFEDDRLVLSVSFADRDAFLDSWPAIRKGIPNL